MEMVHDLCDFVSVEFVVTYSSTGPRKQFSIGALVLCIHADLRRLWTLECLFRSNVIIFRAHKTIQGDDCRTSTSPRRRSWLRFPWLSPIRNPFELRGLCRRSDFGPRTCGRSINHFSSKVSHFRGLRDDLEYNFLGCIRQSPPPILSSALGCFVSSRASHAGGSFSLSL